ncbi:hypothetical protein ACFSCX_16710 [Bacillus salitolerans]|uniref:Uncharacterized protein n=1 Tax=Bacillus salitolerans TaxID=1437434 RepID=A0ABW4LSR0_9BACI
MHHLKMVTFKLLLPILLFLLIIITFFVLSLFINGDPNEFKEDERYLGNKEATQNLQFIITVKDKNGHDIEILNQDKKYGRYIYNEIGKFTRIAKKNIQWNSMIRVEQKSFNKRVNFHLYVSTDQNYVILESNGDVYKVTEEFKSILFQIKY